MKKRTALLLAALMTAGFLLVLLVQGAVFAPAGISVCPQRPAAAEDARLDLNLASAADLQELPGIGPVLSDAIVSWRVEHGGFRSPEELLEVPGIGEKTLAGIQDYLIIGGFDP